MRLNVKNVVIKGEGKPVKDAEGNFKYDNGELVKKYNTIGYIIEDLDHEIPDTPVLKSDAGKFVSDLINKDLLESIKQRRANGEEIDDEEIEANFKSSIENAIISTRTGDKLTLFLRAKPGVLRSLECEELVVNFLDEHGNVKEGFEFFNSFKPRKSSPKHQLTKRTPVTERASKTPEQYALEKEINKDTLKRTANVIAAKCADILPAFKPKTDN